MQNSRFARKCWVWAYTAEYQFNKTDSNTASNTVTETFPSQSVVAAPHGTTTFINKVQRVEFSGTGLNTGYLDGTVLLQKVHTNADGTMKLPYKVVTDGNWTSVSDIANVSLSLYDLAKLAPKMLPSYLEFDDVNRRVKLKQPFESTFTGTAGTLMAAQIEFKPEDSTKPTVTMSYKEYQDPAK